MGNVTAPEVLARRWAEILSDPLLRDLPYKIELNAWGKIEMSPLSNAHGRAQAAISARLDHLLRDGEGFIGPSVLTEIGVRVPDVAWASRRFLATHGLVTPFPLAPEICIEVLAPSDTADEIEQRIRAYLAADAHEVWTVAEDGRIRFFGREGERTASSFGVSPVLPA